MEIALREKHILIPAIRYPTVPKGKERLRITISAMHTREDIDMLIEALNEVV